MGSFYICSKCCVVFQALIHGIVVCQRVIEWVCMGTCVRKHTCPSAVLLCHMWLRDKRMLCTGVWALAYGKRGPHLASPSSVCVCVCERQPLTETKSQVVLFITIFVLKYTDVIVYICNSVTIQHDGVFWAVSALKYSRTLSDCLHV